MVKVFMNDDRIFVNDNGTILEATSFVDDKGRMVIRLPKNSANRQYLDFKFFERSGYEVELEYKATRVLTRHNNATKPSIGSWSDYMTDEEKSILDEIKAKCQQRLEIAKINAQIAELQKLLEEAQG